MTKTRIVDLFISAMLVAGTAIWADLLLTISLRNFLPMYPWDMIVNILSVMAASMLVGVINQRWQPNKIIRTIIFILPVVAYIAYYTISRAPFFR